MGKFGTGQAIRRKEDERFITGSGRYTDDITFPDQGWLCFFRSPYAHGVITRLDVEAARAAPGVLAVYIAGDLAAAGVRDVPGAGLPASSLTPARKALRQPPLARDRVRYVGEPVAAIVAATLAQAKDAAEMVELEVDELPAAATIEDALADGATPIHDGVPGNHLGTLEYGEREATDAAFADARHVVAIDVVNNRLAPTPMEPRGCNVTIDRASGHVTVHQGCQGSHPLRQLILKAVPLDGDELDVRVPDVGGAFGLKFCLQCETVVAVFACKTLERSVKWIADRSESFLSDVHGRDHVSRAELALDEDGRMLAMRASITGNVGAYCSQAGPIIPWFGACMSPGAYEIPVARVEVRMALTNTVPLDAYRGAGRPEAAYLLERLVDKAARQLGMSRVELRRRNFIRPERFPCRTATESCYDSGEYERVLDGALARADWNGFEDRRSQSAGRGRLRGIGLAYYVEICSIMGGEDVHVAFGEDGRVSVLVGTQSTGQGHETTFAQMVAGALGVDIDLVDVVQGDTARVPSGDGTAGSRTMAIAGSALSQTVERVIESGRRMAAALLEAAAADIELEAGDFRVAGTDRGVSLAEVVKASFDDAGRPPDVAAGLASRERFVPGDGTFPNGCHVCEVEIDPETGVVDVLRYTVEDDIGNVINPLILEGQIVGGVVQGLGQASSEHAVYDRDGGQLLTATFMDYAMPRADRLPRIDFGYREIPSPRNPLGVKGAGEAGTVGAAPAYVNAVLDALAARGIEHADMPLTPMKIWKLLNPSNKKAAPEGAAVTVVSHRQYMSLGF